MCDTLIHISLSRYIQLFVYTLYNDIYDIYTYLHTIGWYYVILKLILIDKHSFSNILLPYNKKYLYMIR
jgi:hypothetical protein